MPYAPNPSMRRGITLIEVLLVVVLIALLITLSIPAVQAARESARYAQCMDNQRQLGIAFVNFESRNGTFPSVFTLNAKGPLAGAPEIQIHNFMIDLLEDLEQPGLSAKFRKDKIFCDPANAEVIGTNLRVMLCPSAPDREAAETKYKPSLLVSPSVRERFGAVFKNLDAKFSMSFRGGMSDYGIPIQTEDGLATSLGYSIPKNAFEGLPSMFPSPLHAKDILEKLLPLVIGSEEVRLARSTPASHVIDGLSKTFMLTETAGRPQHWQLGVHTSVGEPLPSAWSDPFATAFDIRGIQTDEGKCIIQCGNAGEDGVTDAEIYSFHPGGANFLFADGHAQFVDAGIDKRVLVSMMTPDKSD